MTEQMNILSPWAETLVDGELERHQQVSDDYPALVRVTDITGTPVASLNPDPNNLVCRVAGPTATLDAIEGDVDYVVMEGTRGPYQQNGVLLMNDLTDIPTQSAFVQWRNSITSMQHGGQPVWNTGDLNKAIGPTVAGRTWGQINEEMRLFLAAL